MKWNGPAKLVVVAVLSAAVGWGVMVIPTLFRESGVQESKVEELGRRIGVLKERVGVLEEWGPNAGKRFLWTDAGGIRRGHQDQHDDIIRRLDQLYTLAGLELPPLTPEVIRE